MEETPDFMTRRAEFLVEIDKSFEDGCTENIKNKFIQFNLPADHKCCAFEQAMRDKLLRILCDVVAYRKHSSADDSTTDEGGGGGGDSTDEEGSAGADKGESSLDAAGSLPSERLGGTEPFERFIKLCLALCQDEIITPTLVIVLMGDIFDATTLDICQALFEFMEKNFTTWKDPLFFASCKNNILRMCNDLLRRLSKSQNTLFCGRILLFLAMYFPFSERSGLNIVSEFNLDNVTKLETEPSPDDVYKNMMEEVFPEIPVKIDYNFYCKFWSLQDYFRNPNQCYNRAQWREFVNSSNAVLSVFRNCKVEADPIEMVSTSRTEGRHYFVKFLTSQKLLALQLNDVHFRRTIYLQFLILFQYLNAHVKSRPESYELSADQVDWVRETTELVHKLIKETPPHGKKFMKTILQILQREEHWITWKNEGCPALKPVATKDNPPKRTKLADSTTSAEASSSDFSKLSKLNRRPLKDVLIERKDKRQPFFKCLNGGKVKVWGMDLEEEFKECLERKCIPTLKDVFDDIIQQSDPSAMIEQKYKKVNQHPFAWSSLRLLRLTSPHFYAVTHNPIAKLPDFLEQLCKRISREPYYKRFDKRTTRVKRPRDVIDGEGDINPMGVYKFPKDFFSSESEDEEEVKFVKPEEEAAAVAALATTPEAAAAAAATAGAAAVAAAGATAGAAAAAAATAVAAAAAVAAAGAAPVAAGEAAKVEVKEEEEGAKETEDGVKSEEPAESQEVKTEEGGEEAEAKTEVESDADTKDSKEELAEDEEDVEDEEVDEEEDEEEDGDEEEVDEEEEEEEEGGENCEDQKEEEGSVEDEETAKIKCEEECDAMEQVEEVQAVEKEEEEEKEEGSLRKKLRLSHDGEEDVEKKEEDGVDDDIVKALASEVEEVIEIDLQKVQDETLISKILEEDMVVEEIELVKANMAPAAEVMEGCDESAVVTDGAGGNDEEEEAGAGEGPQHNGAAPDKKGDEVDKPAPPQPPSLPIKTLMDSPPKPTSSTPAKTSPTDNKKKEVAAAPAKGEPSPKKATTEPSKKSDGSGARGEKPTDVSDKALERVIKVIGPEWTKLAENMGYKASDIKKFSRKGTSSEKCRFILNKLLSKAESPSVEWLQKYLKISGFEKAAAQL